MTYKGRHALRDFVLHACGALAFFCNPAALDETGSFDYPLSNVGRYSAESWRVRGVELAHLAVSGFDAVVCDARQLRARRVGVDDDDSGGKMLLVAFTLCYFAPMAAAVVRANMWSFAERMW